GLHTTVYAPGADEVKLLYLTDEGTWEERDWFISDAWGEGYRTEIHWNEASEYTLGASAHYADGDVWTNPQNCQITIPVLEPIGELTAPIMHGQPDSVVRGEFVTVTVDPVENATSYDLGIYGGEGDNWYELDYTPGDYREDAGTLTVSTASLPEGHYVLRAAAWAYGYVGSESLSDLRIRESDDSVHLFVDRTTALTHEDVRASIVAPGADSVRLYVDGEEREQWGGDVMDAASVSFGLPGDGILTASACFGGEWTDPEDCRVVLNITAPYGSAGAGFSMPEEIGTGDDLVISLDHMEDISAEWWLSFEGEGNSFEGDGRSDRGPYVISASDLAPRRVYRVHFSAWGQGYEDFYQEQCVMVSGAQDLQVDDQGSTLTMRIPKDTVDTYELLPITLFAPGADGVQLYRGNQEGEWELDRDFSGSTGAYIEYNWRYPDDYVLGASAYYADGDVWTDPAACQITILVVSTKGELGSPDVQMQDKAYLGDQVPIIFGATDHATDYGFWVHRSGDDEWLTGDTREGAGEFVLDTYALGIGTFFVETDVDAVGYTEGHTSLHLAVLDPDDIDLSSDDFYFTVSTTDVLTHEDVHLIAYAPGAEAIRLYTSSDACEEQDGPGIDRWMSWGQEDEIPVSLSAFYDGEWSEKAEMCTIHVRAPYGDLPVPEVGYASLVPTNEDYIFTVRAAENVHYDVRVNWIGDWEFDLQHEEDCEGAQTFTVDSQYIDNPDHFMIRVWYWYPESMVGYNDGYLEYHFRAEDDPNFDDEKVTLTVEKDHALINEDVEITVTAQGASEIRLYNLDGEFDAAEGDTWNRTTAEEFLYARALIDGTWYTSSPVTIAREYLGE
ncbi:MAG: hypothetical protein IJ083_03860, partial [Clostridia bacterium]|nr:hypothetical protein [Clostridia bacterium]